MAKGTIHLTLDELTEQSRRLDEIHKGIDHIRKLLERRQSLEEHDGMVAQFTLIALLRTTFPTFKKWIVENKIKPIRRGGRVFYRGEDARILMNGRR